VADEGLLEGEALLDKLRAYLGHLLSRGVIQIVGENEDYVGLFGRHFCSFFFLRGA